ncbi:MAG: LCP family protein, partial [Erysipelotrichaceae bacterium]|nr:LCP family protein [Erysipelotrichaceae bacterium]
MSKNKKSPNWIFVSGKYNIILFVLLAIINVSLAYIMRGLTSFSNLSKTLFIIINIVVLLVLLILDIVFIINLKSKKSNIFKGLLLVSIVLASIGGYGSFAMFKVNKNVNKIITSEKQTETVETSIVVNNGMYLEVSDLDGKTVGIVAGTTNAELGKSHLDSKCDNVTYAEYNDINSLFTALVANEIDAAVLPSNYKGIFEVVDGYEEALENTEAIDTFSEKVTVEVSKSDKDITSEPFSVLVLGVDEGRSDANMVVTFNPISLEITMTSIARDSYVPIACYAGQSSDKLGHAHVQGVQCTIDTIENLLGIEIDYYFESNFAGVVSIVDALGGIIISNPYEFVGQNSSDQRGHYTVWVPAGENIPVNGEQALAFARERHLYASGDFQRQANQQQVITSILKRAMETRDLNKLLSVLDAAGDNIKTNISVDELITLFNYVMEKTKRYYGTENIETMFKIVGSRVTGYNSSVWSEASQLALSIVRPYEGSIKDNREAINRNLNLDSTISANKYFYWEANSEFYAPTISNETYSEKIIQSETPQSYYCTKTGGTWNGSACACPVGDFVENKGCSEAVASDFYDAGSCIGAGFIWNEQNNSCVSKCPDGYTSDGQYCKLVKQNPSEYKTKDACTAVGYKWNETNSTCVETCPTGSSADSNGVCKVNGASNYKDKDSCVTNKYKWDETTATCLSACPAGTKEDTNGVCKKDDSAATYSIIIRYVKEDGSEAAPSYTATLKEGEAYSVTSPSIDGYTADASTVSGTMGKSNIDLTVKYKKNGGESTPTPTPTP